MAVTDLGPSPDSHRREPNFAYRPALDGVRALAVAGVLLFHGGVAFLPGGFLGVDAFFVLSGFLITSLLLAEYERSGRIGLTGFWGRRARRLLPALLVMLAAVFVLGRALLPPHEAGLLRGDTLAALGYVANWRMVYRGEGYFAETAGPSPLQHTWSLGIEEQFYLLWPLLVVLVLRFAKGRALLLGLALLGTAASVYASVAWYGIDADRAYFGTDSRAQALLIGAVLAIVLARFGGSVLALGEASRPVLSGIRERLLSWRLWLGALALVGLGVQGWLWTTVHGTDAWLYYGGLTLAAVTVAAVLAHVVLSPRSLIARALAIAPLVWLGRISYGVYLWHWPLYGFVNGQRTGLTGPALLAVRLGLTLVVAIVSYYLVELPIRRGVRPWWAGRPRLPQPAASRTVRAAVRPVGWVASLGITAVAVAASATIAVAATSLPSLASPGGAAAGPPLVIPTWPEPPTASGTATDPALPPPMQRKGRKPGDLPRVDFFGDSVSWTLGTYLPEYTRLDVNVPAIQGCGITLLSDIMQLGVPHTLYGHCPEWPSMWQSAVDTHDPDVSVILLDRWEFMDAKLGGVYRHVGQPRFDTYLLGQLDQAVRIAGSNGARIVLLTAPYTRRSETPSGELYSEDEPERVDAWNRLLRTIAAKYPDTVTVLDLNRLVCPEGTFTWSIGNVQVRSDGLHFTPEGVQQVIAPWLMPQLTRLAVTGSV